MKKQLAVVAVLGFGFIFVLNFALRAQTWSSPPLRTQSPSTISPGYAVVERGAHHRVWQRVTAETNRLGRVHYRTNSYTELATGMHYLNDGQWHESQEVIESYPGGAIARHGAHKVIFANNLNTAGAIDLEMPDGQRMQSHILGLSYLDVASGKSVLIAEVKDSQGQLVPPNEVIYPDAFTDFRASVRLTYSKAGLEQDVILEERPPSPEAYGLSSATTWLLVLTEFVSPVQPVIQMVPAPVRAGAIPDQFLDFGFMAMGPGTAFTIGQAPTASGRIPVSKEWAIIEGRNILLEQVPVTKVAGELNRLPVPAQPAMTKAGSDSVRHLVSTKRLLPGPKVAPPDQREMQLAKLTPPATGLVLDYTLLNSSQTNYTFRGNTTYYISGSVSLKGTNILEAGAVLKYARYTNSSSAKLSLSTLNATLLCQTAPYHPAIFTAVDDDTVGETIDGSTGTPTNSYEAAALALNQSYATNVLNLHDLRVSYATVGFRVIYGTGPVVTDAQFVKCASAFEVYGPAEVSLRNVLVQGGASFLNGDPDCTARGEHVTLHQIGEVVGSGWDFNLYLTNSLLVNVTNNNYPFTGDHNATNSSDSVFATVGAGAHYLADDTYRNAGTTNIGAPLLAGLKSKTTYPPVVLSNVTITVDTTLSPQAQRDTDLPDLGYHYDPIDYAVEFFTVQQTRLTISPGTVIAPFGVLGIQFYKPDEESPQAELWVEGTPVNRIRFCDYRMIQEQAGGSLSPIFASGWLQKMTLRFADFDAPVGGQSIDPPNTGSLEISDCAFRGPWATFTGDSVSFRNNLFEGTDFYLFAPCAGPFLFQNNLVHGGGFGSESCGEDEQAEIKDNVFYNCTMRSDAGEFAPPHHHNVLVDVTVLYPGGWWINSATDMTLTNVSYQEGPLGRYYQPTNSPLINAGSQSATNAGLYHYTVTTNQVKETNSTVDIGFHYVALDTNSAPVDTDEDGLADYFEDTNGNGVYDSGTDLSSFANSDTFGNGLPDGWQWKHFGNFTNTYDRDFDGDNLNNLDEYNAGSDPNTIQFTTSFATDHVNSNCVSATIEVTGGVPSQMAILVNNTNFTSAAWISFGSNVTANLGSSDGVYEVWVGLRGRAVDSEQTWEWNSIARDTAPPSIVITNPISTNTSRPMIQLQGYSPEPLASIRFDLTNALGSVTNLEGFVSEQYFDTNNFVFTTNWFECVDIELTNGVNTVTLRLTDLAGNVAVTNLSYTLDYSGDTNPPVLTLYWPQNGAQIGTTNFTVRGWVDDPTATITAQIVSTNGTTNGVAGLVERNGLIWVEELPLAGGTNVLTLTATDAAGNLSVTNLSVVKSSVQLTINDLPDVDMNSTAISVGGTINDSEHKLWVNGVEVTNVSGGNWTVNNVPLPEGGTAVVQVRAIPSSDHSGNGTGGSGGATATFENPGNPSSTSPKDVEAQKEKAPAIRFMNFDDYWYGSSVFGQATSVAIIRDSWRRNVESHGSYRYVTHDSQGDSDCLTQYTWPPCIAEQGCDEGAWTNVCTNNGVATSAAGDGQQPYPIGRWYCKDSFQRFYEVQDMQGRDTITRFTGCSVVLLTGGKANSTRQNLFSISADALEYRSLWDASATRAIPSTEIIVGDLGRLGSDGHLFKVLSDNVTRNLTVRTPRKHYSFNVGATKHKLRMFATAAGQAVELGPDLIVTNAEFCVGQKIVFSLQFDPALPGGVLVTNQNHWFLPPKYVNAYKWFQPAIGDPSSGLGTYYITTCAPTTTWLNSGGYDIYPPYCTFYRQESWPLSQPETGAWWVSDGDKIVSCYPTLTFTNGQMASLAMRGQFNMFRPKVTLFTNHPPFIPLLTNGWVELGNGSSQTNSGDMRFDITVETKTNFSGWINQTQLVNRHVDWVPIQSTSGYELDNDVSAGGYAVNPTGTLPFVDNPGISSSVWPCVNITDQFQTYLRFKHGSLDGDDLWVTLGIVTWGWSEDECYGTTINSTNVIPPTYSDSDNFPQWDAVTTSSPGT